MLELALPTTGIGPLRRPTPAQATGFAPPPAGGFPPPFIMEVHYACSVGRAEHMLGHGNVCAQTRKDYLFDQVAFERSIFEAYGIKSEVEAKGSPSSSGCKLLSGKGQYTHNRVSVEMDRRMVRMSFSTCLTFKGQDPLEF
ncbi:hypothetical protein TIFTF001_033266 [Ficus carica]|uniref:Uncharacterized protein n=1 Tax=Ficus carica TaxID=3494 RepID=A0AA88J7F4_FICCA|nr:hypothetical protein TIFTF001_033266 [Ficus carica]